MFWLQTRSWHNKRLRFLFFNTAGRIVRHARKMLLRVAMNALRKAMWMAAFRLLPVGP